MFVSDRRIYLNSDRSRVVDEQDPDAAYLLVGVGGTLDDATAQRYGLTNASAVLASTAPDVSAPGAVLLDSGEEKAEESAEDKAVSGPEENKAIFPGANKRAKRR